MLRSEDSSPGPSAPIKVVILEDERYDRMGMIAEVSADPGVELICATAQPQELLAAVTEHRPHVAVIDLRIYGDDAVGLGVIQEIKHMAPAGIRVIVVTALTGLPPFLAAFRLGVEAYVTKAPREALPTLSELARLVVAGGCYYDPDLMQRLRQHLRVLELPPDRDDTLVFSAAAAPLSARELEILHLLAGKRSNQQIATELVISPHTVKSHIRNIKIKWCVEDIREAILIAVSQGILNSPPPKKK